MLSQPLDGEKSHLCVRTDRRESNGSPHNTFLCLSLFACPCWCLSGSDGWQTKGSDGSHHLPLAHRFQPSQSTTPCPTSSSSSPSLPSWQLKKYSAYCIRFILSKSSCSRQLSLTAEVQTPDKNDRLKWEKKRKLKHAIS